MNDYIGFMRRPLFQFHPVVTAFGTAILSISLMLAPARAETAAEMDALFSELAQTEGEGWARAQSDIERIWSRSGSAAMDLLLQRGEQALDMGDIDSAIGHLTALTDHAPDFAAGWAARAAAFHAAGEFGPAAADLAATLRLEPRHWGALTLLAAMLEETGDETRALKAYRASLDINPHQPEAEDGAARLSTDALGQGV
ncbi:MAG TPA: tetratricopeptide repeat protein [Paracoccus sp. (in: a-proteobacteria)]|nr:tetratricopeptide repeat protein [Paracoccus sp. (in: a-proteobacteria)]